MKVFSSLEEENRAEHRRLAARTPGYNRVDHSIDDLLEYKRSSDRPKDLADVDELEKTIKK